MTIFTGANGLLSSVGATAVDVALRDGQIYAPLNAKGTPLPMSALVDTGGLGTRVAHSLVMRQPAARRWASLSMTVDGAISVDAEALLDELSIGTRREPGVEASASDKQILGIDVLSRFRVTLDLRNRRMYLEIGRNYAETARLSGTLGMAAESTGGRITVSVVIEDQPAAKAGIRVGDTILSVDERPVDGLTLYQVMAAIRGWAGTDAVIEVCSRNGPVRRIKMRRGGDTFSSDDQGWIDGLQMSRAPGEAFAVMAVAPGSIAATAGIKSGDALVAIDGKAVAGLDPSQLITTANRKLVKVRIRHPGAAKEIEVTLTPPKNR